MRTFASLGILTFVIVVTLVSLTLGFLTMPITYPYFQDMQVGIFLGVGQPGWQVDSMGCGDRRAHRLVAVAGDPACWERNGLAVP